MPDSDSIANDLKKYFGVFMSLPITESNIPGAIVEEIIALARGADVLRTYDYVDVVVPGEIGWQVKSTKESTPVTWKRAKIPDKTELIEQSLSSAEGLQDLGDVIIEFCNAHARQSLELYDLKEIHYSRCIVHETGSVRYFERSLCSDSSPDIFAPSDFQWRWSSPKKTQKKEQLPALHGFDVATGEKMWAWHGHGENQLHFSGEGRWWRDGANSIDFNVCSADQKMSWERFFSLLSE